jgi:uncharacterized protein (TIGR03435 family)
MWAYNVQEYQLTAPSWVNDERYDITAKADGRTPEDQLRAMLQTLLKERFKLELHRQTKVMQVYALVVAKGGHKMQETASEGPSTMQEDERKGVVTGQANLWDMTARLSQLLGTPVVDMTGLKGRYAFTVNMAPYARGERPTGPPGAAPAGSPGGGMADMAGMLLPLLQEQMGLKLEARKMPVELIVIDRAEKVPEEN